MNPLDRDAWRALPLQFIVIPTLGAPVLAFPPALETDATLILANIADLHQQWRLAFTPERKKTLAIRIRREWLKVCSLADGVRMPGRHAVHCFLDCEAELQRRVA